MILKIFFSKKLRLHLDSTQFKDTVYRQPGTGTNYSWNYASDDNHAVVSWILLFMDAVRNQMNICHKIKTGNCLSKKYQHNQVMMLSTYVLAAMYSKRIKPSHVPKAGRHIYLNHWGNLHKNKLYEWIILIIIINCVENGQESPVPGLVIREFTTKGKSFLALESSKEIRVLGNLLQLQVLCDLLFKSMVGRVEKHVLDATDDKYGSAVTAGGSVERSESH